MKDKFNITAARRVASKLLLGFTLLGLVFLFGGCSTPATVEQFLFTASTNTVPTVTNQVLAVTVTNDLGLVETRNVVTWTTNLETVVTYTVSTNAAAITQTAGRITDIFAPGAGELVTLGAGGLLALWARLRGKKAERGNVVMAQGTEMLLALLETQHGAEFTGKLKAKLASQQEAAGVLREIATLVKSMKGDNDYYRMLADQLLKTLPKQEPAT